MDKRTTTHIRNESFSDKNVFAAQNVESILQNEGLPGSIMPDKMRSSGDFGSKIENAGSMIEGPDVKGLAELLF